VADSAHANDDGSGTTLIAPVGSVPANYLVDELCENCYAAAINYTLRFQARGARLERAAGGEPRRAIRVSRFVAETGGSWKKGCVGHTEARAERSQ
jgi:hypothetical protein